jgi:hypothetical protein
VILSSYVYENIRLLLLSTASSYPHGLSNNHGQVGKYYRSQTFMTVNGLYPNQRLNGWGGTEAQTVNMDDLYGDNFDHPLTYIPAVASHAYGGAKMGEDPTPSVVNQFSISTKHRTSRSWAGRRS